MWQESSLFRIEKTPKFLNMIERFFFYKTKIYNIILIETLFPQFFLFFEVQLISFPLLTKKKFKQLFNELESILKLKNKN